MTESDLKTIGERIIFLRKKNNFTQNKLAEILTVTQPSVSKWEKGENSPGDHLSRIAEIFNVSVDWLLGRNPLDSENNGAKTMGVELVEYFEIPISVCAYAEIWKNYIDDSGVYELWVYDMFYKMKRRMLIRPFKNNTSETIKSYFLEHQLEILKEYRDFFDKAGISPVSDDDRAFLESAEEFALGLAKMEHELWMD
ncbi:helix-turn-helix domain-containing protein [Pseudobutyrivibrio sp. MD2005]|uniref:helix-turn-helix domain-containing protein n=1 Tax=Pseudobutyrivibrio sp. MD2005 TaxID=1410616 RepID=UPI000687672B|nr:helix-turn-helix transcriptional regulator [Pseudobutyrivibrio sp. MD2005]